MISAGSYPGSPHVTMRHSPTEVALRAGLVSPEKDLFPETPSPGIAALPYPKPRELLCCDNLPSDSVLYAISVRRLIDRASASLGRTLAGSPLLPDSILKIGKSVHFKIHKFGFLSKNQGFFLLFNSVRVESIRRRFDNMEKVSVYRDYRIFLAFIMCTLSYFQASICFPFITTVTGFTYKGLARHRITLMSVVHKKCTGS
jgi:hypothetical protein